MEKVNISSYVSREKSITECERDLHICVNEYYMVNDGSNFDDHFFIIKIVFEGFEFTVDRSYVDFVELARRLRKSFPQCESTSEGVLPLEYSRLVEKQVGEIVSEHKHEQFKSNPSTTSRNSIIARQDSVLSRTSISANQVTKRTSKPFVIPEREINTVSIKSTMPKLNDYLNSLIKYQEILTSDDLLMFLDEEVINQFLRVLLILVFLNTLGVFDGSPRSTTGILKCP